MFLVDTNVLVYAFNEDAAEHARCRGLVEDWRASTTSWHLSWPIVYEFLRVATHPRALRRPRAMNDAARFVAALLESPGLKLIVPTDRHAAVLSATLAEIRGLTGSIVHELATAVLMREHGIRRIVTLDADFARFPFLEVIDPLNDAWPAGVRESVAKTAPRRRSPARRT